MEKLASGDKVNVGGHEVATQEASMPVMTGPTGAMGQLPSGLADPVNSSLNDGTAIGSGTVSPASTTQPVVGGMAPTGAAGRMTEAGRGVQERHSVRGGFAPATGGRGSSGEMIREGRGPHLGQSLGRGARSGVPFAGVGSGAGSGMHAGLNGGAGAGGCMSFRSGGGIESGVGSGSSEGAATSRGGNPGRATGSARAYGPMMGMRGKDNEKKRAKSVTTQVERDPNKRDLLGGAARCRTRCHRELGAGSEPRKIA